MSRDGLGRSASPAVPAPHGPAFPDDLDVDARSPSDPSANPPTTITTAPARRRWPRLALALLLSALLGAAAALLAVRAGDEGRPPLTLLLAWGDGSPAGGDDPDRVLVDLVLANTGDEELVVTSAGTGRPPGRLTGELRPSGLGLSAAPAGTGDEVPEVVLPPLGSAALGVALEVSCTDPPPWQPWVEVRRPSTATEVVDLPVVDDLLGSGDDAIVDACSSDSSLLLTPAVVGQHADGDALVLSVRNDTEVPYRVEVVDAGTAGLSLEDEDVRLPATSTTDVRLRVAPPDCAAAVRSPDLLADVGITAVRLVDGAGPARTTLVLDPFVTGGQVGIGVGRACAGTS